jgi:chaperonin GroEL
VGIGGDVFALDQRRKELQEQIGRAPSDDTGRQARQRLDVLAASLAVIRIGAATELEYQETFERVEDALRATRAAAIGGFVPGGGIALVRARASALATCGDDAEVNAGVDIVSEALTAPFLRIVANTGVEPLPVLDEVLQGDGNLGFNAATRECGDLVAMGIIDPTAVVRSALTSAASVASMLLSTDCVAVSVR